MFVVVTPNALGAFVPLKGTVWALDMSRAQKFPTRDAAQTALDNAKKFMKVKTYNAARIVAADPTE